MDNVWDVEPQLANCRDYWLGWGASERADGEVTYYRSGLADAQLNGVLRLRAGDRPEQAIGRAAGRMAGVPWLWWVGPDSAPDTAARLAGHGAVGRGAMPVMAVRIDEVACAEGPADLKIEAVEGSDALREWVQAYMLSFGVAPELLDDVVRAETRRPDSASIVRLAGRRDGRVVGTSLMFDAHGVAGVYVVTTSADQRRQGIGTALTAAALEAGRARGLSVGTLQASASGTPVYLRMGFEQVAEYGLFEVPAP
ncbi:acetyltransferase [Streptomyces sp. TS71-3]|nr:acetyltransferase [Streptomyces sp. TS71-3]